jgi:transcriptional regulator with XRE-family HTH domain
MDLALVLRQRLKQLGLEQRDLATAAQFTESYISQLLAGKKASPAPGCTDIYDKMGELLGFTKDDLARIADFQRKHEIKKGIADRLRYSPSDEESARGLTEVRRIQMALRIVFPDYLDNKSETYLISALQACGAQHLSGNEWSCEDKSMTPSEFIDEVEDKLREDLKECAAALKISTFIFE